jgi:MFS family permease
VSRLGPLAEREFRLLFASRTISFLGTAIAPIALAFAVLDISDSGTALGLVLAVRQIPQVILLLVGGVWADRLPRNVVMVGANLLSGASQLTAGALILAGEVELWHLAVLAGANGAASAFFFPASQGIVPQTVSEVHLQNANVLLRMGVNATMIGGAAAGGALVAVVGAGWAIVFDSATYLVAAGILTAMRIPALARERSTMLHDLREGWREFSSRTWLWVIVVAFGFVNAAHAGGDSVLAPVVAKRELGGAGAFGLMMAGIALGFVVGGLIALKWRPRRLLLAGCSLVSVEIVFFTTLALEAPLVVVVAGAVLTGIGFELFGVFWDVALQQNIPQQALSRVYSYDAVGSFVLMPMGLVVAGPLSEAIGVDGALWAACAVIAICSVAMLAVPDVRRIRRTT